MARSTRAPGEAFKTHSSYVRAFAMLARHDVAEFTSTLDHLATRFRQLPRSSSKDPLVEGAMHSLGLAWRTELLLDLTRAANEEEDFTRLANTWAVVQLYYITYHCTQALAQAKGHPRTESHPKTRKLFKDFWVDRPISLPPWSLGWDSLALNVPSSVTIDTSLHSWSNCDPMSCWSLAAKALRTTRAYEVEEAQSKRRDQLYKERRRVWEAEEKERLQQGRKARKPPSARPMLSKEEKGRVAAGVRAMTLMDYMWRLRVRTNYEDSSMFTDGPSAEGESREVRDNLMLLASGTLLVHELSVIDLVSGDAFMRSARSFLASVVPSGADSSLEARWPILEAHTH